MTKEAFKMMNFVHTKQRQRDMSEVDRNDGGRTGGNRKEDEKLDRFVQKTLFECGMEKDTSQTRSMNNRTNRNKKLFNPYSTKKKTSSDVIERDRNSSIKRKRYAISE